MPFSQFSSQPFHVDHSHQDSAHASTCRPNKLILLLPISHVTERMTSRYREKQLQNDGIKRYHKYHMNPMQWSLIVRPAVFRRPEGTTKHHTTKRVIRKSCMIQEPTILRLGPGPAIILNFCLDSVKNLRIVESNDVDVC